MIHKQPHSMITKKTEYPTGETWEFQCPRCGYHLRFTRTFAHGDQILEVIDRGDPHASHFSSNVISVLLNGRLPQAHYQETDAHANLDCPAAFDEASWLTPELRDQIGQIMRRFDSQV